MIIFVPSPYPRCFITHMIAIKPRSTHHKIWKSKKHIFKFSFQWFIRHKCYKEIF